MKSFCSSCSRKTNHTMLHEYIVNNHDPESGWWDSTQWQIIKCDGCDSPSFRKLYEDVSYMEMGKDETLFPPRNSQSAIVKQLEKTPKNIVLIYNETINSFNNGQLILCAGGIRAVIEGICKDKSIMGGNVIDRKKDGSPKFESDGSTIKMRFSESLEGKIEGLHEKGFLTTHNAKILHELRFLGNYALHELIQPSKDQLIIAITIVDHIIETIYEIHHKASKLTIVKSKKSIS